MNVSATPASRRAWLLVGALVLAGCATPRRAPVDAPLWTGRLSVRVDATPVQSFGAGFELQGGPIAGELRLSSPLGNTLARVVWSPAGAELHQGSAVTRRGSLDDLTTELAGAPLPIEALFGWLQGRGDTAAGWQADLSRHADGRITARRDAPLPRAELRVVFER